MTSKSFRFAGLLATLVAVVLSHSVPAALADVVDVQFAGGTPQTGAAVIGSAGDNWNQFAGGSGGGRLADAGSIVTGLSLTYLAQDSYTAYSGFTQFTGTPYANLMQGILWSQGSNLITMMLAGLPAGEAYSLYVYTQGDDNSAGRMTGLTVNGQSRTATQTNTNRFIAGDNYLVYSGNADASGDIAITGSAINVEANVNGFQLVAADVPEPASLMLLGGSLAGLAAARRRWRKRSVAGFFASGADFSACGAVEQLAAPVS